MAKYTGQTTGTQAGDIAAGYIVNGVQLTPGANIVAPTASTPLSSTPVVSNPVSNTSTPATTQASWKTGSSAGKTSDSYIQFAGSPDIFSRATGARITEQEASQAGLFGPNGTLVGVQTVSAPRPGVTTAEQYKTYNNQPLSSQEMTSLGIGTPAEIPEIAKDYGINQFDPYQTAVSSARATTAAAAKALADFQLMDVAEIKSIAINPDLTKRLAARRISFINDPQSEYWLQRMALQNELNSAQANESNIIQDYNMAIENYNLLKPDLIASQVDASGTLVGIYSNPLDPTKPTAINLSATGQFAEAKDKKVLWSNYDDATGIMTVEYSDGIMEQKKVGTPTPKKTTSTEVSNITSSVIDSVIRTSGATDANSAFDAMVAAYNLSADEVDFVRSYVDAKYAPVPTNTTEEIKKTNDGFWSNLFKFDVNSSTPTPTPTPTGGYGLESITNYLNK